MADYYKTLDVAPNSSLDDIKKSYRRLALKWHPDKNPNNQEEATKKFREISEAYEILSNEDKKRIYDKRRNAPLNNGFRYTHENYVFKRPEDIFNEVFKNHDFVNPQVFSTSRIFLNQNVRSGVYNKHDTYHARKVLESLNSTNLSRQKEFMTTSMWNIRSSPSKTSKNRPFVNNLKSCKSSISINETISVDKSPSGLSPSVAYNSSTTTYTTKIINGRKVKSKKVIIKDGYNETITTYDDEILISKTVNSVPQLLETVM